MKDLSRLSHEELYRLRSTPDAMVNQALQDLLAGYEHRAFAREIIREKPYMALPVLSAIPLYQAGKATGLIGGSRSKPGLSQLGQGLLGIYEGMVGE